MEGTRRNLSLHHATQAYDNKNNQGGKGVHPWKQRERVERGRKERTQDGVRLDGATAFLQHYMFPNLPISSTRALMDLRVRDEDHSSASQGTIRSNEKMGVHYTG